MTDSLRQKRNTEKRNVFINEAHTLRDEEAFVQGFDYALTALAELAPEYDEKAAKQYALETTMSNPSMKFDSASVLSGARWAHEQAAAQIAALRRQLEFLRGDREKFLASDDCFYWTPEAQAERDELRNKVVQWTNKAAIVAAELLDYTIQNKNLRAQAEKLAEALEWYRAIGDDNDYRMEECLERAMDDRAADKATINLGGKYVAEVTRVALAEYQKGKL